MGKRRPDSAAIKVDDLALLTAGENDSPAEGVTAVTIEQAGVKQQIEGIAQCREMASQISAGSITNAEFFDQGGIVQSAVGHIASGFRMVMELELVKGGCLLQQLGNGSERQFLFEKRHRLAERQIEEELDEADQVAATAAAVAVEQVFAGIDVERRARLVV